MTNLKKGDNAPQINAPDQNGKVISLNDYKGKKVIIYFYPKDDTPGCTAEACNLRDNYEVLLKKGYAIIGVSADSEQSHKKFISKYNLPFPLISDIERNVLNAYGVWGEKKMYGKSYQGILRTTFIISENGKIEFVIDKVETSNHTQQILDLYQNQSAR
jgi:thioredoxin-dependent peroxiredoxin